jgi:phenylalanyl-tRNA synthetase beta chain
METDDLEQLVGYGISAAEIFERLEMIGAVIERRTTDSVDIEVFPDRPDLFSVEGLARAMRAFLGMEPGIKEYEVAPPQVELRVDPSVLPVRHVIACGVVRGIEFNDPSIASLMDFQEKLHLTVGRHRKKVSIGVHDMRDLVSPYTYLGADPEATRFFPLQGTRELNLKEILMRHPKGVEYAWVLEGHDRYPLIVDAEDKVLSFPPIINGTVTQVREDTHDLFLDVTGLDEMACRYTLRILATMLAERGGQIEAVKVVYPDREVLMPDLNPSAFRASAKSIVDWIGIEMGAEQVAQALRLMGFNAEVAEDGDGIDVTVPSWRMDILHEVDLAEDVGIGYGYDRVQGVLPEHMTLGVDGPTEALERRVHVAFRGRGYTEVMSFTLSSVDEQYTRMRLLSPEDIVMIQNPVSEHLTTLRTSILPDLLAYLGRNSHNDYPQSVYELGDVVRQNVNELRAAAVHAHAKAGFTLAKSLAEGLVLDLDLEGGLKIEAEDMPCYISGRCARMVVGGDTVGHFGEVHPEVLETFGIAQPTIGLELDLEALTGAAHETQMAR